MRTDLNTTEKLLGIALLLAMLLPVVLACDTLFQISTICALMAGDYNGTMSFKDLKDKGDFGLGTFDRLDGAMVALDGQFYQVKSDGHVYLVNDTAKTPFAEVTFFLPDDSFSLNGTYNLTQLETYLDSKRPYKNICYAIRINGTFDYVKTSVPQAQSEPCPTLTDVLETQKIFEFNNTTGTVVGFWCPSCCCPGCSLYPCYAKDLNETWYHLHFINENRSAGGHLMDIRLHKARVAIDYLTELVNVLPTSKDFCSANRSCDRSCDQEAALQKVEYNPK